MPLLRTSGLQWKYQPGPALHQLLRSELRRHYASYCDERFDKTCMPLYLFLSGAGTGKSRHATELCKTVIECLEDEDEELKKKLEDAWVFHVSLENGTSLSEEERQYPFKGIGTRMLFQLRPKEPYDVILNSYEAPHPMGVLRSVAKYHNRDLKSATVILVIDGLQNTMDSDSDGLRVDSRFYTTLTSIGALTTQGTFLLACCTATVSHPVNQCLRVSSRRRVLLPVNPLESPFIHQAPVFETKDPLVKLLVDDCGGHGRALEILADVLVGFNIDQGSLGDLMRVLRDELITLYGSTILLMPEEISALALAILTRQRLHVNSFVPNTSKTPDQFVSAGLMRFVEIDRSGAGYLIAPYVWVWAITTTEAGGSLLGDWQFDDYDQNLSKIDKTQRLAICTSEDFERFNAFFRRMKSRALREGDITRISEVHYGAQLNGDIEFKNHHLELEQAAHQEDSRSGSKNVIICQMNVVNVRQCKHIIINARSASSGDAFCGLDTSDASNEVHQYKFYQGSTVTQKLFNEERKKAASGNDFFLLITTDKKCDVKPPNRSGIVHGRNWGDYFGAFAGRMFFNRDDDENPLNINKATHSLLQLVVKRDDADKIISKRPFDNVEDAMERTQIPERLLKRFQYKRV